jgi:16S rRNA (guanine527-N7)-methyltransferase
VPKAERELESLLERAGLDGRLRRRLAHYGNFVLETNRRINLTGAKTPSELAGHLLDSLTVVPYVREPYVDVGSGAGFPAIPVAIATGVPPTMVEATSKRAHFLQSVIELLELPGEVLAERAEAVGRDPERRERFASGTARALATAPVVAELLLPLIRLDGVAVLQRGAVPAAARAALEDAALMLGGRVEGEHLIAQNRRILLARKVGVTPERFPRRTGKPAKRPLCS